jgi:hypothetical protein
VIHEVAPALRFAGDLLRTTRLSPREGERLPSLGEINRPIFGLLQGSHEWFALSAEDLGSIG